MGYPYGDTYLDRIQKNKYECEEIKNVFYVLRQKYVKDHDGYNDSIDLNIQENFALLGEAFELASETVGGIMDAYHFLWDVVDALLMSDEERAENEKWEEEFKKEKENAN